MNAQALVSVMLLLNVVVFKRTRGTLHTVLGVTGIGLALVGIGLVVSNWNVN